MQDKRSKRHETVDLQSRAEAHLYVAVAKADGILSKKERAGIGHFAVKAQKLYDVLDINGEIAKRVRHTIKTIVDDIRYHTWTTENHLDEAISLFKEARESGNWSVALAGLKHEHGLLQVALLDDYVFAESVAVKKIIGRLERELGGMGEK